MTRMASSGNLRGCKIGELDKFRLLALGSTRKKLHQEEMKSITYELLYLLERNGG